MKTLSDALAEELKDPEFRKEWDALEPEFAVIPGAVPESKTASVVE